MNKRKTGKAHEELAAEYLNAKGYAIRESNYRCKIGEIDLIAADLTKEKPELVFVEVKYRSSDRFGLPLEAVDFRKQQKIIAVSKYYLMEKKLPDNTDMRFDVIGILGNEITHVENAFTGWL